MRSRPVPIAVLLLAIAIALPAGGAREESWDAAPRTIPISGAPEPPFVCAAIAIHGLVRFHTPPCRFPTPVPCEVRSVFANVRGPAAAAGTTVTASMNCGGLLLTATATIPPGGGEASASAGPGPEGALLLECTTTLPALPPEVSWFVGCVYEGV